LSETSKYESLLNDISTIETQVSVIKNKYKDTREHTRELEDLVIKLKKENTELLKKIEKFETEIIKSREEKEINILNSLNLKERETLKIKLQNLLQKIEYHLSAEKQT
jgi:hypothetical protein